tara:strand:- start:576 stop:983 length:408 start_codon:yes stop_codon:yes gene_type:complete
MIRGKTKGCPFGLSIPEDCMCAGDSVLLMEGIENLSGGLDEVINRNNDILISSSSKIKCKYADSILDNEGVVDCKYDDNFEEKPAGNFALPGSPYYPHIFSGNAPKIDQGFPGKLYVDDSYGNNAYYGLFSIIDG